jgi:putative nucleotidyltransferase with HDIG domain
MSEAKIVITGVSPAVRGLQWEGQQCVRIGRLPNMEIELQDPSISRQHAEIRATGHGWLVFDLGSSQGTLVNGIGVEKAGRRLQKGDMLQCGHVSLQVAEITVPRMVATAYQGPRDIKTSGAMLRVLAFSQLTWEQGLREYQLESLGSDPHKHFLALVRAGYHLCRIDALPELLQSLLDDMLAVLDAQRAAVVLIDEATGELSLRTVAGKTSARSYSKSLVQSCFSKGESLLCENPNAAGEASGDMASIICALLRSARRRLGVLYLDRGPDQQPFSQEDFKLADAIAATISVGIDSAMGVARQKENFSSEAVTLACKAMALRDPALVEHGKRVASFALLLADELGLPAQDRQHVRIGALLHDVGKIGLPGQPARSSGPGEHERTHPLRGVELAQSVGVLAPVAPIIRHHHECWDGSGFPDGLKCDAIPRSARVVAVANALDHLSVAGRRGVPPWDEVIKMLRRHSGRLFDPDGVEAAARLQPNVEKS